METKQDTVEENKGTKRETDRNKHRFRIGLLAGLAAGIVATGVMLLLSVLWNGISLPEVFGSELTALMPSSLFNYLHETIGADAKHYLFYGIIVGQCLVFGLSGALFNLIVKTPTVPALVIDKRPYYQRRGLPRISFPKGQGLQWYHGLLLAFILWLFTGFILLPLTSAGIFGSQLTVGFGNGMVSLAVVGIVFGLIFVYARNWLTTREAAVNATKNKRLIRRISDEVIERRMLLKRGVIWVGIGLLGIGAWRFITEGVTSSGVPMSRLMLNFKSKIVPPPVPNYGVVHPAPFLSPEVTSNDQYYVVSKNLFSDPIVNASSWNLTVDGQVDHPIVMNYQKVLTLPMQQQYESMMCISNEVGGEYMSNALWEGIRLKDLLQLAGVKPGATKVVFHAVDDYSDSIHLSKALEPTTLMAVRMNGVALPDEHGFPARMLVPGIYGMKHCKWLNRIEVVNYDYQGYWQMRGWSDGAPIHLTARIDTPLDGSTLSAHMAPARDATTFIAGVAFSGNLGISEVDVSTDGGETWQVATLKQPLSMLTWVLWELEWRPNPGNYTILARAIDMEGNVQTPIMEPPLPDGSTGYHTISVIVS
jgi:DMSO/TMAO reductase YedYZ molybdopterin-dependent catalytic subunit